jgi:hypothetical protein
MKLIQSRDNAFYKSLKRLAESGRERRKTGRTLLDGVHLVEAWETRYGALETLVVGESALAGGEIADFVSGRECTVLGDALLRELGLVDTPSGLLAVVAMPGRPSAVDLETEAVLLDGVQDPATSARCCAPPQPSASGRCCCRRAAPQPGRPRCCAPGRVPSSCSTFTRTPTCPHLSRPTAARRR